MKAIWTFLCLATAAVTAFLAFLFVDEPARTDKFWLALGAVELAEFLVWFGFISRGPQRGEQAASLASGSIATIAVCYFLGTLALAAVAIAPVSFKVLLALHILALLAFVLMAGISAIGSRALQTTSEANRPQP